MPPSYVSYEYALSYYGLIPERVYEITSATLHSKKSFDTPIGRFTYKPGPLPVYAMGIDWLYDNKNGGKLIATPEKALCDKIRADRGIGKLSQEKLSGYFIPPQKSRQQFLKSNSLIIFYSNSLFA